MARPKREESTQSVESILDRIAQDPALQKGNKEKIRILEDALTTFARSKATESVAIEQSSKDNVIKFVILGDTQLGSLYERVDVVEAALKVCEHEGIHDLFHTGDVLDGHKGYPGQEFELHKHGWDQQRQWFKDRMPTSANVRKYFITGNHDAKFKIAAGIEVGKALEESRPDWKFIGTDIGSVTIRSGDGRPLNVALIHPDGGTAYALSYRPQRIVEQWAGGSKPDILGIGHYHKAEFMPRYRNVACVQSGCCQDQTPFMKRKSLAAHVGFWIIEAVPSKKRGELWSRYKAEFVSFYENEAAKA